MPPSVAVPDRKVGIWNATDEELKSLRGELDAATKDLRGPPCLTTSLIHLSRDVGLLFLFGIATYYARPYVPATLLWSVYIPVMGTLFGGWWVTAHECGHGAFGPKTWQNDVVGFVLHSALLTPYWSWKFSHSKHHRYTNHIVKGETWTPSLIGEKVLLLSCIPLRLMMLPLGMPSYFMGQTQARTQFDGTTPIDPKLGKSHLSSRSQTMPTDWRVDVSAGGVGAMLLLLGLFAKKFGAAEVALWYFAPYLVCNFYTVLYTWLHHTDENVPHYGDETFTGLRGAMSTIDRTYPWAIEHLHHRIGSTHVAHHVYPKVPHYRAAELTERMKTILVPKGVHRLPLHCIAYPCIRHRVQRGPDWVR